MSPQLAARLALRPLATDSVLLIDWRRSSIGRRPMLLRIGLSLLLLALVASGSVVAPTNLRSETATPPDASAPAPGEPSQRSADKGKGHLAPASAVVSPACPRRSRAPANACSPTRAAAICTSWRR